MSTLRKRRTRIAVTVATALGVLCGMLVNGSAARAENKNIVPDCLVSISNYATSKRWGADLDQPGAPVRADTNLPLRWQKFQFMASSEPNTYRIWSWGASSFLVGRKLDAGLPVRADGNDSNGSWERVRSEVVASDDWGWTVRLRSYANDQYMLSRADDPSGAVRITSTEAGYWELVRVVPEIGSPSKCWPKGLHPTGQSASSPAA